MSAGTPIFPIEGIALDSTGESVAGSLGDVVTTLQNSAYGASNVYPTMAGGVPVTSGVGVYALSAAFVEVVPTTTIRSAFHIRSVVIEAAAADVYEVVLYAVEVEIARFRFAAVAAAAGFLGNTFPVDAADIPADTQIQVKTASLAGGGAITLSLQYHLHV